MVDSFDEYLDPDSIQLFNRYVAEEEKGKTGFYDVDEYISLIETCIVFGDMQKGQRILRKARAQYPEAVDLKLKEAELYLETDCFEKALRLLEEVENIEPYLSEIYILRGHVLKCLKKCVEARQAFLEAKDRGADELDVIIGMAETEITAGAPEKAWVYMQRMLGRSDDTIETCNRFLEMAHNGELLPQAIEFVNGLIRKNPYSIRYWRMLSELYEMAECYAKSSEADNFILAIEPEDEETLLHKFCLIPHLSYEEEQLPFFYAKIEKLARESGDKELLTSVWLRLARFYETAEADTAENYYRRLLDFSEYRQFAFFRLGVIATCMQRYEQALNLFFEALRCEEEPYAMLESPARIYRGIACACFAVGNSEEGLRYNRLAVETEPEYRNHLYVYALNACCSGNAGQLKSYILQASRDDGQDASLLFVQACLKYFIGQKEEAYGLFMQALAFDAGRLKPLVAAVPDLMQDGRIEQMCAMEDERADIDTFGGEPFAYYGPEPYMNIRS